MKTTIWLAAISVALMVSACKDFDYALTGHARPAAQAAGYRLDADDLARLMAASSVPDSALTPHWAGRFARLWADYVSLALLYDDPDSTSSLDYTRLLEDGRFLATLAVERYHDSVVLAGVEPTEQELREYWDSRHPMTRLDVRRVRLRIEDEASDVTRDSVYEEASAIRTRLVGGADFVQVAREASDEPVQARGQVIAYQGHDDFPPAADSIVFSLQPGEISPVIATGDEILIYRIEGRRSPDYESAKDLVYEHLVNEREAAREEEALATLVDGSHRVVADGAGDLARRIAADANLAEDRIQGGLKLVRWDDGDLVVDEIRSLFLVRGDIRDLFVDAPDEELEAYLMELARDEILISAATRSGIAVTEEERAALADVLAEQLSTIANRYSISTQAVANPRFDVQRQSLWFLQQVLERSHSIPWLGEFRVVLDPVHSSRVDEVGVEVAARHARELRAARVGPSEVEERPEMESPEERVEVG